MVINGGNGVYHAQICLDYNWHQYFDVSKSASEIKVWTSDQGFACPEYNLIFDDGLILKIVKHYYDYGTYCPDVDWQGITV